LVGKINLASSNGNKFIITATNYFTKWIEAIALICIKWKQISMFILNYLICQYKIPQTIRKNNETPFKNQDFQELYSRFSIQHLFSTHYYPQGNGQVEASNKTILKILKKTINVINHDCYVQFNPTLWAY
jgi:CRISPR/Cas system-associated protein Cas5 (RAMP superfamily)